MRHTPHLLIPGPWSDARLNLTDTQSRHLTRVLRRADGDPVSYSDGQGLVGEGVFLMGAVARGEEVEEPKPSQLTMAVAPPRTRDRTRFLVEKLAELGVARLRWLRTVHGIGKPPNPSRSLAWSVSALEQSRSGWLMDVDSDFSTWSELKRPVAVCAPGGTVFRSTEDTVTVAVGPEGGWSDDEIPEDCAQVSLGPTLLRSETAALVAAVLAR